MTVDPITLGKEIAAVRQLRGMTQKSVAELADISVNYLSLVENGERSLSPEAMNRIAKVLRVPAGWLSFLGGTVKGKVSHPFSKLNAETRELMLAAIRADSEELTRD